jgi:hypothetical protein
MSTGRKHGQIVIEYKCRVLLSSKKLSNLKVIGFSKLSEAVYRKKSGFSKPQ